jgi:hypothetical protein
MKNSNLTKKLTLLTHNSLNLKYNISPEIPPQLKIKQTWHK